MKRRGFLAALAALVAAPWVAKPLAAELRGCTFAEWTAAGKLYDSPFYWHERWLLETLAHRKRVLLTLPRMQAGSRSSSGLGERAGRRPHAARGS